MAERPTYERTLDRLRVAKSAMIDALKAAEAEQVPAAIYRKIDRATAMAEAAQNQLFMKRART